MNKLILYVCAWICLHSCGFSKSQEESMLEYALSQAGDNRKELEYVIKYYEGDSLKREAARFLIRNMSIISDMRSERGYQTSPPYPRTI